MKRELLENYLHKQVLIKLFDGTLIFGYLYKCDDKIFQSPDRFDADIFFNITSQGSKSYIVIDNKYDFINHVYSPNHSLIFKSSHVDALIEPKDLKGQWTRTKNGSFFISSKVKLIKLFVLKY